MARKKEYRLEFENPQTREKLTYIGSQYPAKSMQELIDLAVDCLFKQEAENIQKKIIHLMRDEKEKSDLNT